MATRLEPTRAIDRRPNRSSHGAERAGGRSLEARFEHRGEQIRRATVPPLAGIAAAFALGIALDRLSGLGSTTLWVSVALGTALVARIRGVPLKAAWPLLGLAIAALGAAWHHHRWTDLPADDLARVVDEEPRPAWIRGVLLSNPERHSGAGGSGGLRDRPYSTCEIGVRAWNDGQRWHPASGRLMALIGGDPIPLIAGDPVQAAGWLSALPPPTNPGQHDPRRSPRSRGIRLKFSVDGAGLRRDAGGRPVRWRRALGAVQAWSAEQLDRHIDPSVLPVASALVLGRRAAVPDTINDIFAQSGTAHLLAISGMHLQAVAWLIWLACRGLGLGRKRSAGLLLFAALGFATLVGWRPSVARATVMIAAACLAMLIDRAPRAANLLALAALATLIQNPAFLFEPGWQLSFLAVAAILFVARPLLEALNRPPHPEADPLDALERRLEPAWKTAGRRLLHSPIQLLIISTSIWMITAPLVAWWFHTVALLGILLNLIMIPSVMLGLVAGGLAVPAGVFGLPGAEALGAICDLALSFSVERAAWARALPGSHLFVPSPPLWSLVGFYALAAVAARAVWAAWPMPARLAALAATALIALLGAVATVRADPPGAFELEVLDVGHGSAAILQAPDGTACLFDCGRVGTPDVGRRVIAPALWSRGLRRLEAVVLSHADADHFNGLPDLLERFEVARVIVPPGFAGSDDVEARLVVGLLRRHEVPIQKAARGDRLALLKGLEARALHPPRDWMPEATDNERSLVIELRRNGRRLLLPGDLDGAGTEEVLNNARGRFDVIVAPHHGGRTANPPVFYAWADPRLVISSQGRPRSGASDHLAAAATGRMIEPTWKTGAVTVRWGSESWAYRTARDPRFRPLDVDTPPRAPLRGAALAAVTAIRLDSVDSNSVGEPRDATANEPAANRNQRFNQKWIRISRIVLISTLGCAAGLVLCVWRALVEWGAWAIVVPGRGAADPDPTATRSERLKIQSSDGSELSGLWMPAPAAHAPIALVLHGLSENGSAMRLRAEVLRSRGWSVLAPDGRASGRSGGAHATHGALEADDARRWLDAVSAARDVPVVLWGRSMGAAIALRTAALDDRIDGLILEAPYADLKRAVARSLERLPIPGAARLAGPILRRARRITKANVGRPTPIESARSIQLPTLVLLGAADCVAPPEDIRPLIEAFPATNPPEVLELPEAGHTNIFEYAGEAGTAKIAALLERAAQYRSTFNRSSIP